MAIKTCDSFLEALEKSDLLDADQLATARQLARQTDDPRTLAILLVQKEFLTRWQAGQLLAGRTSFFLGRYKLIDLLGRGGMGNVFLAQHTMMNRPVAIKMISRELSQDPASRERFLEEARAIAALDHPNIVHAYTVDSEADRYYMVLEFVEGQDLQRLVEAEGPLAFERAADYIRQAADGLAHAHAKGMIHCDIKPSNLLVNAQGVVKILDMGMSRLVGRAQEAPGEQGSAEEQKLLGTVDYLAPEQAVGSPDLDHRADIYSLGCTLYFLLTGSPPFPEGTLAERLLKHQIQEPPSILLSRPDAPRDLVKLCEKMMAKSPADRCNSAEEVSRFLAAWRPSAPRILKAVPLDQGAVPKEAATGRAGPRAKRRLKVLAWLGAALGSGRRRAAVLAALGLMAAAFGGVSLAIWFHPFRQTQTADASATQTSQPKPTSADQQEDEAARLWPGLKLPFDKPTPAKPKPAAPSQPAPKLANSGSPGPPAAAKPEQGPASPAKSVPAAKPGPEPASQPPAHGPAAPPKEPDRPKPPSPPADVDPLKDLPKTVDLPPIGSPEQAERGPASGVPLFRLRTPPEVPWQLGLIGGERVLKGGRRFAIHQQQTPEGKPGWLIWLGGPARSKEEPHTEVARLWRDSEALVFQWLQGSASVPADFLRNCALELRAGGPPRLLPLRSPQKAEPILLDLMRPVLVGSVAVDWLPDPSHLRLEITKVEGRQGQIINPAGPLPLKTPATMAFPRKDRQGHLVRGVDFRLNFTQKRSHLLVDLRLLYPQPAMLKQIEAMTQAHRAKLEEGIRALQGALGGAQRETKFQIEQQLNLAEAQLWYDEFFTAVHRKARLHFRILADLDGYQLELARTEPR